MKTETIVKLRDAFSLAADALQKELEYHAKKPRQQTDELGDTGGIIWVPDTGLKGPFDRSVDYENPRHQALAKTLQSHQGKMTIQGEFFWLFPDGKTIGKKLKK